MYSYFIPLFIHLFIYLLIYIFIYLFTLLFIYPYLYFFKTGCKTSQRTLKATTHQCIRNMGLLEKWFKKDKAQLWYKNSAKDTEHYMLITWRSGTNLWGDLFKGLYILIRWCSRSSSHVHLQIQNIQVTPLRVINI